MKHSVLSNNLFLLKICIKAAPLYAVLFVAESIVHVITTFLEFTIALNFILEAVEFGKPFSQVLWFVLFVTGVEIFRLLLGSIISERVAPKAKARIKAEFKHILYEKAQEIDLENYDNPEFYNSFILSLTEADNQIEKSFSLVNSILHALTTLFTTGIFFLAKDAMSIVFVILPVVGTFFVMKKINALNLSIKLARNPHERKRNYAGRVFYLNDYAKEIRLHPEIATLTEADYFVENEKIREIDRKHSNTKVGLYFFRDSVSNTLPHYLLYSLYLVYKAVVTKTMSISDITVMFIATRNLKRSFQLLTQIYPSAEEISLFVSKIREFLQITSSITSLKNLPVPKRAGTLELKNVSFAYNKTDGYILKNINLKIEAGQKCAFVGYNGAGKTTLIKLIMRLYDPTEGGIYLDGINIKDYDVKQYRDRIGTVFQDYKIYALSLLENVLLDIPENTKNEDTTVIDALEKSGFSERLKKFPKGLHTPLTAEFEEDGVNLSGGEAQKVAIARVFPKERGIIILDEPSSALDPISEYHLNESMLINAGDSTVIFISHRLSTTRDSDKIFMLENGQIIEQGTHMDLVAQGGKYAQLWIAQAGQYRKKQAI